MQWIHQFLSDRYAQVSYGVAKSKYVRFPEGLPQGSHLSCSYASSMTSQQNYLKVLTLVCLLCGHSMKTGIRQKCSCRKHWMSYSDSLTSGSW